jgi:hypothetical protein
MTWNSFTEIANAVRQMRDQFGPAPHADATPDARSPRTHERLWELVKRFECRRERQRYNRIRQAAQKLWRAHRRAVLGAHRTQRETRGGLRMD